MLCLPPNRALPVALLWKETRQGDIKVELNCICYAALAVIRMHLSLIARQHRRGVFTQHACNLLVNLLSLQMPVYVVRIGTTVLTTCVEGLTLSSPLTPLVSKQCRERASRFLWCVRTINITSCSHILTRPRTVLTISVDIEH